MPSSVEPSGAAAGADLGEQGRPTLSWGRTGERARACGVSRAVTLAGPGSGPSLPSAHQFPAGGPSPYGTRAFRLSFRFREVLDFRGSGRHGTGSRGPRPGFPHIQCWCGRLVTLVCHCGHAVVHPGPRSIQPRVLSPVLAFLPGPRPGPVTITRHVSLGSSRL